MPKHREQLNVELDLIIDAWDSDGDTCCDDYAIDHPGTTYCPECQDNAR
jgi:hypothetical protein